MGPNQFEFHFPEEVWEQILEELTDDEDRVNCCLASPYLDWILTRGKPVWLFKKILPFLFEYLDIPKDIRNCRRVCSQWCADIDNLIQRKRTDPLTFGAFTTCCELDSHLKLDLFLQEFSNHHSRNPFLDRTVYISAESPDANYQLKVKELFERFGRHIWMLQISPEFIRQLGRFEWHNFLQNSIKHMPNLRKLVIFDRNRNLNFSGANNDIILNIYGHYFRNTMTIPAIPSLEFCCSDQVAPDDTDTHSILVGSNLSQLQIQGISGILLENMDFQMVSPKLLKLGLFHSDTDDSLALDGRRLQLVSHINKFKIGETHVKISIQPLLKILRNFPSVKEVSINWSTIMKVDDPSIFSQIENTTVRSLTIAHIERFSYNFLRAFKTLEVLTVDLIGPLNGYQNKISETVEEDLQFYEMLEDGKMYESNVWKIIPSLAHVKICVHQLESMASPSPFTKFLSGTRGAYEEHIFVWVKVK